MVYLIGFFPLRNKNEMLKRTWHLKSSEFETKWVRELAVILFFCFFVGGGGGGGGQGILFNKEGLAISLEES